MNKVSSRVTARLSLAGPPGLTGPERARLAGKHRRAGKRRRAAAKRLRFSRDPVARGFLTVSPER